MVFFFADQMEFDVTAQMRSMSLVTFICALYSICIITKYALSDRASRPLFFQQFSTVGSRYLRFDDHRAPSNTEKCMFQSIEKKLFSTSRLRERNKSCVRHRRNFCMRLARHPTAARSPTASMALRPPQPSDSPCKRRTACGRMSEQRYQSIVMDAVLERTVGAVLTKVRGILQTVADESLTLLVDPFEIEVLIPEHTRRHDPVEAGRADHAPHDLLYRRRRDGEPADPPAGRVPVGDRPRVLRDLLLGRRRRRAEGAAGDGPAGPRAGPHDPGPGRQAARRRFPASARRPPSGSSPSCAARSASSP